MIRVAVAGAGYWGPNLIRNFVASPDTQLVAVCDRDEQRLSKALAAYPNVQGLRQFDDLVARTDIDAVAIATPVATHAPMAIAALESGKHVLVEKPLAASIHDAERVTEIADRTGRVLMVDHTFVYSSPVQKIKQLIDSGEIGDLYFIDSVRINLGMFQHDVNVVWDLAPHDLSILDYLLGRLPKSISAFGTSHADGRREIEDVAYMNLDYGNGLLASLHVNWLSPVKVRHFIIGGSRRSVVYNDLEPVERVKVYDRGISINGDTEARRGVLVDYRTGDVWSPHIPHVEPLARLVSHFAECIRDGKQPITSGQAGLRIVKVLEAAQRSIKAQGGRITL
ncbi:MAG TPA: Gfo/Idh/MocA family oxidoreductase [Lacipirellulaceae bacterium]|nr:Gfo/Idh/MocA family oxidoreductase [Lacipirellulaceae bacterium]